jgi:hypothetical protein
VWTPEPSTASRPVPLYPHEANGPHGPDSTGSLGPSQPRPTNNPRHPRSPASSRNLPGFCRPRSPRLGAPPSRAFCSRPPPNALAPVALVASSGVAEAIPNCLSTSTPGMPTKGPSVHPRHHWRCLLPHLPRASLHLRPQPQLPATIVEPNPSAVHHPSLSTGNPSSLCQRSFPSIPRSLCRPHGPRMAHNSSSPRTASSPGPAGVCYPNSRCSLSRQGAPTHARHNARNPAMPAASTDALAFASSAAPANPTHPTARATGTMDYTSQAILTAPAASTAPHIPAALAISPTHPPVRTLTVYSNKFTLARVNQLLIAYHLNILRYILYQLCISVCPATFP